MKRVVVVMLYSLFMLGFSLIATEYTAVIPVSYDENKQEWSVLLGLGDNNQWTCFYGIMQSGHGKANAQAAQLFAAQTNNVYNIPIQGVPWKKIVIDNNVFFMHVVPVNYQSGKYLYTNARNQFRTDFVWISAQFLEQSNEIAHKKSKALDPMFLKLFRDVWSTAKQQLSTPQQGPSNPKPQTGIRNTWGAASNKSWTQFFGDTVYANKPTTVGFEKYYCFMNTYPYDAQDNSYLGQAPIALGLYYDVAKIGKPMNAWQHAESYYQAMKAVYKDGKYDSDLLKNALNLDAAGNIMDIYKTYKGQNIGKKLRPDWQRLNLYIMLDLVRAKFMQNKNMMNILMSTAGKYIVEETTDRSDQKKDSFFGNEVGRYSHPQWVTDPQKQPGQGSNILGQILMHVRKELESGKLLPVTLYTEPVDFFNAQAGPLTNPVGKTWTFLPGQSALKPQDMPLLVPKKQTNPHTPQISNNPSGTDMLMPSLNNLKQKLNQLEQVIR